MFMFCVAPWHHLHVHDMIIFVCALPGEHENKDIWIRLIMIHVEYSRIKRDNKTAKKFGDIIIMVLSAC